MTAVPEPTNPARLPEPPDLMTAAQFAALGEVQTGRYELLEGRVLMAPSATPDHNVFVAELRDHLKPQLPAHVEAIFDIDVDLELAPADQPGFVRRPDLIVADRSARSRVRAEGGVIRASEVLVAIEIISPGSRRADQVDKRGEYADAGIPHYWIVDLDDPMSLTECHLAEGFGYQDPGAVAGTFATTTPFPVEIRLDQLL